MIRLAKSSDPVKLSRILRLSEYFYNFMDDKSPVTPRTRFTEQKAKSIHASKATRGYQNLGVSSNSMR